MRSFLALYALVFAASTAIGIYAIRQDTWGEQGFELSLVLTGFVVPVATAMLLLWSIQRFRPVRWFDRRAHAAVRCATVGLFAGAIAWLLGMASAWAVARFASMELAGKVLPHDAIASALGSAVVLLGVALLLPRAIEGCCVRCGHDLSTTDAGRCTECGSLGTRAFDARRAHKNTGPAGKADPVRMNE